MIGAKGLRNFLIIPILPRFAQELKQTTFLININRMIKLLYVTVLVLVPLYFMLQPSSRGGAPLSEPVPWQWICLGIFLGILAMLLLCYYARARLKANNPTFMYFLEPLGCIFFLALGLALAYAEIRQIGNISTYYVALILATTAFYIKPIVILITTILAQAAIVVMLMVMPEGISVHNQIVNTSLCAACLFVVSRLIYLGRVRGFVNRREILHKNSRLQQVNRELLEANEHLQHLYHTDQLTGIANRQQLYAYISQTLQNAPGNVAMFGVFIMDIDSFKAYNDKLGHLAGDACLVWVANELQKVAVKYNAFAARFGGEEFIMLRHPCSKEQLAVIGEEIRACIARKNWKHPNAERGIVTISVGGALETLRMEDAMVSRFIIRADEALYVAKNSGRNRFISAEDINGK